jgi:hypothetical protein
MSRLVSVVLPPNRAFFERVSSEALRFMRSVRVVAEKLDPGKKLVAASIYAVFQSFLSKIVSSNFETQNLGSPTKVVNYSAARGLIQDLLEQGNQGAGFCFERKADSNNPVYYGAFYVQGGPFKMACLTKFMISNGLLVALVFDLYFNSVFKFKSRLRKPAHVVCENLNLSDPLKSFRKCLTAMLGILTGTRA